MADFISDYRENSDSRPDVSKIIICLKAKVFIMNADYAVIRDLVILNEPYIKGR